MQSPLGVSKTSRASQLARQASPAWKCRSERNVATQQRETKRHLVPGTDGRPDRALSDTSEEDVVNREAVWKLVGGKPP